MPKFDIVSMAEAGAIQGLEPGQAGRLVPGEGERVTTVRRRLGAAAKLSGKELVIKRVGEEVYFWSSEKASGQHSRGRPRKTS